MRRWLEPRFPFDPTRFPLFYGWVVLGASVLGVLASIPGQTMGVSVFTDDLIAATGLSRLGLSWAYLAGTLGCGLLMPGGGSLLDRLGTRATVAAAALLLAMTLVGLAACDRAIAWLGGSTAAGVAVMGLGFFLLRFSGQGMLTLVSRTMLGRWWDRRRGLVSGIAGLFISFGFAAAPLVLQGLIDLGGWRGAWLILAAVSVGTAVVGWLLFRDRPEDVGLLMDGAARLPEAQLDRTTAPELIEFTRPQAVRTLAFWALVGPLALNGLTVTAITFHIVDLGALAGLDRHAAVAIFLPMAVVSTAAGYLTGLASDRWPLPRVILAMLALQALGYTATAWFDSPIGRSGMIAGIGGAGGCFATLITVGLPRYFGRKHLGAIGGVQMAALVIASALGPMLFAAAKDVTGSYDLALWGCLVPLVVLAVLAAMSRNPQHRAEPIAHNL